MSNLLELADRVEAATGPDRKLDALIGAAVRKRAPRYRNDPPSNPKHFTASLDAAMTLLSDGSEYDLTNLYGVARAHVDMANEYGGHHGSNECGSMPLAVCAAALRARAASEGGQQ
jgi:hypothetical protein